MPPVRFSFVASFFLFVLALLKMCRYYHVQNLTSSMANKRDQLIAPDENRVQEVPVVPKEDVAAAASAR